MNSKNPNKVIITERTLLQISSVLLAAGGLIYVIIQFLHPLDALSSVETERWVVVGFLTSLMSLFVFIGLLGLYVSQVRNSGVMGLLGFLIFGIFWLISMIFSFNEAFLWPLLVSDAPELVDGMTGIFGGGSSTVELGIFPSLAAVSGVLYIIGGIVYGIALIKAKHIPLYSAVLLIASSIATVGASMVTHPYDRTFAIPMGASLIILGINSLLKSRPVVFSHRAGF